MAEIVIYGSPDYSIYFFSFLVPTSVLYYVILFSKYFLQDLQRLI